MSDPRPTAFAKLVAEALKDDVLTLIDVGCSSGIDPAWRLFGPKLRAFAFDPNLAEVGRLTEAETLPGIQYIAAFVGIPPESPDAERMRNRMFWDRSPHMRSSAYHSYRHAVESDSTMSTEQKTKLNAWSQVALASAASPVILQTFLNEHDVNDIDFLKIDVDGADYVILRSVLPFMMAHNLLGLKMEVNFFGSDDPDIHTFHNVDRLMKQNGFELFALSTRPYSSVALPAPFQLTIPAQTEWGRVLQGDAIYFRDAVALAQTNWANAVASSKLLKLAASFSLFGLPDCAAEVLLQFRDKLENLVSVSKALDALVSDVLPEGAPVVNYEEYIEQYQRDHPRFWPAREILLQQQQQIQANSDDSRGIETVDELGEAQQELENLRSRVDEIVSSRSWRITMPIRRLAGTLRRLLSG